MVDIMPIQAQILYTILGLGFMLILGLQGLPGGPKNCIQPYAWGCTKNFYHGPQDALRKKKGKENFRSVV